MLESYPEVLNVKEVSEILRISLKMAYSLMSSNAIPYRRIGRHYKISKDALIEYLSKENN